MSENFRHEVDTHAGHVCEDQHRKSEKAIISFDQYKGHYSLESNDVNLDYWFEMSVSEHGHNPDSHKEEVMMDYGTDNWSSDNEETLQIHPETIPSVASGENWGDRPYHSVTHNHRPLDTVKDVCDSTNHPMMTISEEETESFPLLYSVVLPYTGISRHVKGAGVGLNILGGYSSDHGLVAIVSEVEYTGPAYILGNLTPGCIIHKWNGISLLNKTYEQTKGILGQRIPSNELSLLVCNNSTIELLNVLKVKKQSETEEVVIISKECRRQSIISCNSQQEWVFEENLTEENLIRERQTSLVAIKPNEQCFGHVQLSILCSHCQLEVTLHQGKLFDSVPINALASITVMGEALSNSDELLMSQTSVSLSQTINPVWNHKFVPLRLPADKPLSCTGLHLIIWDCKSDDQYKFVGEVFLNLSTTLRSTAPTWYLLANHDPNLPQLATPEGVKKRATINKFFDRVLPTKRIIKPLQESSSLRDTSRRRTPLFQRLKSITRRKIDKSNRMLVMRPKVSVVNESGPAAAGDCGRPNCQLPPNALSQQLLLNSNQQDELFNGYSTNGRTMEVEAVVEPHAYLPAWGLETEVQKKPNPDLHGFEVRQEQLESPSSSGYTSVHQSETSSTNRNSGFSNYSTSSTESPDVMWHGVDETGIKCSTMIRRSCSMSSFPVMGGGNSTEYQPIQEQYRKPSEESDKSMNEFPRLKPGQRSRSVEILIDTDSSTELSQTDASYNSSQEEITAARLTNDQKPENLIMSFKMKYSAVQQSSAPQKSRVFFIKAKKIKAPFRLFRNKHASDSSQANKSVSSSTSSSSPEGSKVCLTQQRKELGIGQFIPKLDHLQQPCGRIRFSLVQHRRLLLKIRTVEERSPAVSASECGIKATLVQGKEVICKKKVSTTLNSATNPLAEMYLDSRGCTDRMHLHIVITKGSRLSKKYAGEVWVNMKWADLSGLSSWYQLYT